MFFSNNVPCRLFLCIDPLYRLLFFFSLHIVASQEDMVDKLDETGSYKFAALLFSSIDSNLAVPLSLNPPSRTDNRPHHEARQSRQDSRASHRSSLHRSSSLVFRTLPPIRRMPSLQVPSLTDITNPHNIPNPRSLNQIPETSEAPSFKLKLPLTLVHPNSPYVPWDPPARQKILCAPPLAVSDDSSDEADEESSELVDRSHEDSQRDKKPLSNMWNALKSAPNRVKTKCRRLLNPRVRKGAGLPAAGASSTKATDAQDDQFVSYAPQLHAGIPLSPTASFLSSETHSVAVWLSECQRKFLDKDCESSKLMTIDEYDRVGSWVKPGDFSFAASRTSYQCSFVSDTGDSVSGVLRVLESEGDLAPSPTESQWVPSTSRTAFGSKRIVEEERLSRIVHRASLLSYMAERPLSTNGGPPSPLFP